MSLAVAGSSPGSQRSCSGSGQAGNGGYRPVAPRSRRAEQMNPQAATDETTAEESLTGSVRDCRTMRRTDADRSALYICLWRCPTQASPALWRTTQSVAPEVLGTREQQRRRNKRRQTAKTAPAVGAAVEATETHSGPSVPKDVVGLRGRRGHHTSAVDRAASPQCFTDTDEPPPTPAEPYKVRAGGC